MFLNYIASKKAYHVLTHNGKVNTENKRKPKYITNNDEVNTENKRKLINIQKLLDIESTCMTEEKFQEIIFFLLGQQTNEKQDIQNLLYDIMKKFRNCGYIIKPPSVKHTTDIQVTEFNYVPDTEIAELLNMSKIIAIYDKVISLKNYFKSQQFADLHNNGIRLNDNDILTLYTLRYVVDKGLYVSPSPMVTNLTDEFKGYLTNSMLSFVKTRQKNIWDSIFNNDPDIFVDNILKVSMNEQSFATMFYLEYKLKRIIQNGITDFTLNYKVIQDEKETNFIVTKNNEMYSRFILRNVKLIEKHVNEMLKDAKVINNIPFVQQAKEYFIVNHPQIKIVSKGGNLIKMLLSDKVQKTNSYRLGENARYLEGLSDWDFDIELNIHNPFKKLDIIKEHNICDKDYGFMIQQIKKVVVEIICEYFKNLETYYSAVYDDYNDIINSISTHIKYVNHLFRKHHNNLKLNIIKKHVNVMFNKRNGDINNLLCDIESAHDIMNSSTPISTEHDSIFSYISQSFIGELDSYFDLTRLCMRLSIPGCLLKAKAECIDFGLNIPYSHNFNVFNVSTGYSDYTWVMETDVFTFKGKSVVYLTNELIKIVFEQTSKRYKRVLRFFKLFDYAFKNNDSMFELVNVNFKYLENRFMDIRLNVNILDAVIFMFIEFYKVLENNIEELSNIDIFNAFKIMYNNFIDTFNSNNTNNKIVFKYSPNNSEPYPFKSYLKVSDYRVIFEKYYPDIELKKL